MKKLIFVSLSILVFCCCATISQGPIQKSQWLIGTWENRTSQGSIYETWTKGSKDTLYGKSYLLEGKDTVLFETINLIQEANSLCYIPQVNNQNEGLPVRFTLKEISTSRMVFENSTHDFPQVIVYTKINADSLVAEISGTQNGQIQKQSFPMSRLK